jgi:hypothetical protein
MDFPTLVYLLALGAYSLFTWWKKNKAGKNAQKPAQGEAKPEVPEWMKEIFGEAFEESTPKQAPRPVAQAAPPAPKAVQTPTNKPMADSSSRRIETETITKYAPQSKAEKLVVEDTKPDVMALYAKRKTETYAMPGDVAESSIDAAGVSAYEIGKKSTSNNDFEDIDWRQAIILAEVLQPYGDRKSL